MPPLSLEIRRANFLESVQLNRPIVSGHFQISGSAQRC
jgi:hypothetical protein